MVVVKYRFVGSVHHLRVGGPKRRNGSLLCNGLASRVYGNQTKMMWDILEKRRVVFFIPITNTPLPVRYEKAAGIDLSGCGTVMKIGPQEMVVQRCAQRKEFGGGGSGIRS